MPGTQTHCSLKNSVVIALKYTSTVLFPFLEKFILVAKGFFFFFNICITFKATVSLLKNFYVTSEMAAVLVKNCIHTKPSSAGRSSGGLRAIGTRSSLKSLPTQTIL